LVQRETPTWCDKIEGVVDAFYSFDVFVGDAQRGNPAGVVISTQPWSESAMQNLAGELGFSETAFVSGAPGAFHLRWFTPNTEVDLCGHATLASAWVIFNRMDTALTQASFMTRSGELVVTRNANGNVIAPAAGTETGCATMTSSPSIPPAVMMYWRGCSVVFMICSR
jgi:PhzF family phenazine biosynthesis protein